MPSSSTYEHEITRLLVRFRHNERMLVSDVTNEIIRLNRHYITRFIPIQQWKDGKCEWCGYSITGTGPHEKCARAKAKVLEDQISKYSNGEEALGKRDK